MIKPYPGNISELSQQIYNYRVCRARRVIENSFGIMATRFRIYRRPIIANVETVKNVVKATLALHNFLLITQRKEEAYSYCSQHFVDQNGTRGRVIPGQWRQEQQMACIDLIEMQEVQTTLQSLHSKCGMIIKNTLILLQVL